MTDAVRQEVTGIVSRATRYSFGSPEDMARAWEIAHDLAGYTPSSKTCSACKKRALNILRQAIGMPPIDMEAPADITAERLAICKGGCPVYQGRTNSCGRLVVDAIARRPFELPDGTEIVPCGCVVDLKALIKSEKCPAGYWKR